MADRAYNQRVSSTLSLHVNREGENLFVRLAGELDAMAEEPLDKLFGELTGEAGMRAVIVDMRGVSFVDSSGLRILLKQEVRSRRDGFDFALIPPPDPAMRALERAGLHRLIELRTASGTKLGEGAKAGERASAGLGTGADDPGDWLSHPEQEPDADGPMEIP